MADNTAQQYGFCVTVMKLVRDDLDNPPAAWNPGQRSVAVTRAAQLDALITLFKSGAIDYGDIPFSVMSQAGLPANNPVAFNVVIDGVGVPPGQGLSRDPGTADSFVPPLVWQRPS